MSDKIVGQIYETYDYGKFKRLEGNREVKNFTRVLDSINTVGVILNPVLVNEKFEIIDGQHRFEALKSMGLPVYYIMQEGIGRKECTYLNIGQTNWTTTDFINKYASEGIQDYKYLQMLLSEYGKTFKLEGVFAFISDQPVQGGTIHQHIKQKKIHIDSNKYAVAKKRLKSAEELGFCDLQKEGKFLCRSWWTSVAYAFRHPDVSVRELAKKLKASPLELVAYSNTIDQLSLFDKILNKGKRTNKVFMASDYQLGKYFGGDNEL